MDPAAPPKRPSLLRRLLPLVGVALVVFFVSRLDVSAMADAVADVDVAFVGVAVLAMTLNVFVKGWRWLRLLRSRRDEPGVAALGVADVLALFVEAAFLGSFTFGRLGEFVRVARLQARGVPASLGLASCIVDRGLDLVAVVVVGCACLAGLSFGAAAGVGVAVAGVAATAVGAVVARAVAARDVADGARFLRLRRLLRDGAIFCVPGPLFEAMVWTVVGWAFAFGVVVALAHGLDLPATTVRLTAAHAIASVSTLLPVTYQGVGTREPIFAAVLAADGVTREEAVVLALVTFATMLVTVALLGILEMLWRRLRR